MPRRRTFAYEIRLLLLLFGWLGSAWGLFPTSARSNETEGTGLFVFHEGDDGASEAYVIVQDLGGLGPEVALLFSDRTGRVITRQRKLLAPYGILRVRVGEYLGDQPGLIQLQSRSSAVTGYYWRVFANGVSLSIPLTPPMEDGPWYLLHDVRDGERAFVVLTASGREASGELLFYSAQGEGREKRWHLPAWATIEIPVAKSLPDPRGLIVLKLASGAVECYYVTRVPGRGIGSLSRPQRAFQTAELQWPRVPEAEGDMLLIADVSGLGVEVPIEFHPTGQALKQVKRLVPPYGTIRFSLGEFFESSRQGLIRVRGQTPFVMQYLLPIQDRISRVPIQRPSDSRMGLSWPVWQPSQITLRLWNPGNHIGTATIWLNQSRTSVPRRQEVLLAPGQWLDWSPAAQMTWDSVMFEAGTAQAQVLCLGLDNTRLLFVSPLRGF